MELKEISATKVSPYRCYIRGNIIQTEGDNVHTIGFKDGIAVLQVIQTDRQKFTDNIFDNKTIDVTKLKKIIVKIDPKTGKKYIHKDGKKIEILPQITNPILSLKPMESVIKPLPKPTTTQTGPPADPAMKSVIIKAPPSLNFNFFNGQLPKLLPKGTVISKQAGMKVLDNVKYHLVSMNMNPPGGGMKSVASGGTMTPHDLPTTVDKSLQTDILELGWSEKCTQTEPGDGGESLVSQTFLEFILGSDSISDSAAQRNMLDPTKLRTKEEIQKFNFFNDLRNALNFDRSGNLPIHDSVMQNKLKLVQKNCVVLRAIKENVNILNQQCYAPLHLAVLHDVDLGVVKVLLDHGADLMVADPEGNTAIHLAIEHRRSAMLKVLVNGAHRAKFNLDSFNYEGFTPLILACLNNSFEDVRYLLQNGADPNVKDMKSGRTALFHAAECHDVNLVELLMQHHADTKIRNFFGTSPHDAMFELDDMPLKIKFSILGRDHQRFQNKKKLSDSKMSETTTPRIKKAKLETTPVLKKVTTSDFISKPRRNK